MITRRTRITCFITKPTDTHSEYVLLLLLYSNNGEANAPQCYDYTHTELSLQAHTQNMYYFRSCTAIMVRQMLLNVTIMRTLLVIFTEAK